MLIVFTGNGKGKTTAALGQAMRAVGRGKRVLMVQFIKGPWKSGEDFVEISTKGRSLPAGGRGAPGGKNKEAGKGSFKIKKMGLGFVGILGDKLPREDHIKAAKDALAFIKSELPKWDMIICDEINVAVSLGLIGAADVLEIVRGVPFEKPIIFTGRGAPAELIEAADLVTEMRDVKHPFNDGKIAQVGIEF
jgi:cob(I)alamin adenosyltransferase